jgi:hypothetical protein
MFTISDRLRLCLACDDVIDRGEICFAQTDGAKRYYHERCYFALASTT